MSYKFECQFLQVLQADAMPMRPLKPNEALVRAAVDSSASPSLIASRLRSSLIEGNYPSPVLANEKEAFDAIKKAVKLCTHRWVKIPNNDRPEFADHKFAWFLLSWEADVSLVKIQQNRLYKILLGSQEIGGLRRPGRAANWHFFKPFEKDSVEGDWPNLPAAFEGVTNMIKDGKWAA